MSEPLLKVVDLYKSYGLGESKIEVLKGINLVIDQGETVALLGASGAGKSTLMQVVGMLDRPTKGSILYSGRDMSLQNDNQLASFRNSYIGFVFQFHHLLGEFSALENVMMPALIKGESKQKAVAVAKELLVEVGLEQRTTHKPGELSGGEQQRVAVARALVMNPSLLLADEPTGNLDKKTGEGVHELFSRLHESRGLTIIVVTHNEELANRMSRQILLVDGKIYQS
ncbi:MAG: ABC transporter ATP-binding protein [Desulfuromonadales bacterium]|nr:ABC transporter ATP-binding protein [Desulfuromonadales bacterium]